MPCVLCFLKGEGQALNEAFGWKMLIYDTTSECAVLIYFLIQTHLCMRALAKNRQLRNIGRQW